MKLKTNWHQDIGGRSQQQDHHDVILLDPTHAILMVADGMGGEHGGREAALAACEAFPPAFAQARTLSGDRSTQFTMAFATTNRAVQRALQGARGGCAFAAAYVRFGGADPAVWFAHAGDVLGALLRKPEGGPAQVLYETDFTKHRWGRHRLRRCLGVGGEFEPEVSPGQALLPGDVIVLASDGAYEDMARSNFYERMTGPFTKKRPALVAIEETIRDSVQKGGDEADNATILHATVK